MRKTKQEQTTGHESTSSFTKDGSGGGFGPGVANNTRRQFIKRAAGTAAGGLLGATALAGYGSSAGAANASVASRVGGPPPDRASNAASTVSISINLPPHSSIPDTAIYVLVLGRSPTDASQFGYVALQSAQFVAAGAAESFRADAATMARPLSSLRTGANNYLLRIPPISSGRVYFAFNENFDKMPPFGSGGPVSGPENTVLFDKFELDTASNPNLNVTNVDFFATSFSMSVTNTNGVPRTVGFRVPRGEIIDAFAAIPRSPASQTAGNTNIFDAATVRDSNGRVVRVLAPKAAGLSDWAGAVLSEKTRNAQLASHFWDDYVNTLCWKPGRVFSCYSKLLDDRTYYGEISADGLTLNLYTDQSRSTPYVVPSLPRPSNVSAIADFASDATLYHNVDSTRGAIDWGYLLGGNVAGVGAGAFWATDPVAMAIMVSICRGVMHYDDGRVDWLDPSKYYRGDGHGNSTAATPIFYYAKILHEKSVGNLAYALSFDDVYGNEPAIYFRADSPVTLTFNPF